jgi:RHS repeat-associated protein
MATFVEGTAGEGGTETRPEVKYLYELNEFAARSQPICVRSTSRVWHACDGVSDETIETREYSDGFGRLVQRRAQADELAFGNTEDDIGLLVSTPDGEPGVVPGQAGGPAVGNRDLDRVVVSGWQVCDNKGRVIEKYEPFFCSGWSYQPEEDARRGQRVALSYDPRGQLIRTVNPDGSQRRVVFGYPPDLTNPDIFEPSAWMTTSYDENDLAPRSIAPDGSSLAGASPTTHHYTPTVTVADALGRTVCQLVHGGADPARDGHLVRTSYDNRGNVLTVVDAHGRTAFSHAYDLTDDPLRVVSLDAGTSVSVRDAATNLICSIDARGCMTVRTYDELNRPTAVYARDLRDADLSQRERLTYGDQAADRADAMRNHRLGRIWRHLDEAGLVVADTYSFTGQLTEQIRRVVGDTTIAAAEPAGWTANWAAAGAQTALDPLEYRTSTRYDALGRAVEISAPAEADGGRRHLVPTYGRSGALQAIAIDAVPYVRLLAHNARGQRVLIAYGNNLITRYAYDKETFRLTRLRTEMANAAGNVWSGSGPPLQDLTYRYDLAGNVTRIEERVAGCGVAGTREGRDRLVRRFGYDAFYRLASSTGRACDGIGILRPLNDAPRCGSYPAAPTQSNAPDVTTGYRETYTYDPAGNLVDLLYRVTTGPAPPRWHRTFGFGGRSSGDWVYAPNNWLTSVRNGSATPLPIGYDDAGNLISEGISRTYIWDHAGRLVGFRNGAGPTSSIVARYFYGADGFRVKKWVRRGGTPALDESTNYIGSLAEHHRWAEQGGGENALLHVLDGTNRIALIRSGPARRRDASPDVMYEFTDHLGSSSLTADATHSWINREEYFPYGETSFGSFARKRYRYTGMERDEESHLAYHGARYYAPWLSSWASTDPLPKPSQSPYRYAGDNPLRMVDPSGAQESTVESAHGPAPPVTGTVSDAGTGGWLKPQEGGGFTFVSAESAPTQPRTDPSDAGTGGAPTATPASPVVPTAPSLSAGSSGRWSFGLSTKSTLTGTTAQRNPRDEFASSVGLNWSALETSGQLWRHESQSYEYAGQSGAWHKQKAGAYSAHLFNAALTLNGPTLSVVDWDLKGYTDESGAIWGNWVMGMTGTLTLTAGRGSGKIGLKEGSLSLDVGATLAAARLEGGFNLLGASVGVFGEVGAQARFGVSVGSETAVRAGFLGVGVTIGAAKTPEARPGWGNLVEDAGRIMPVLIYGGVPGVTTPPGPPSALIPW